MKGKNEPTVCLTMLLCMVHVKTNKILNDNIHIILVDTSH